MITYQKNRSLHLQLGILSWHTNKKVTAEELGGATLHTSVSGCADYFAADEEESSQYIRDIVETLNIPPAPSTKIESSYGCLKYFFLFEGWTDVLTS